MINVKQQLRDSTIFISTFGYILNILLCFFTIFSVFTINVKKTRHDSIRIPCVNILFLFNFGLYFEHFKWVFLPLSSCHEHYVKPALTWNYLNSVYRYNFLLILDYIFNIFGWFFHYIYPTLNFHTLSL